jgi:uncharacterized protein YijF (DUF1287 family)
MIKITSLILLLSNSLFVTGQANFYDRLADSASTLILQNVIYDPSYFSMDYPNGDVPEDRGVCTDVIIRGYRKVGIDLQQEVHQDMKTNFIEYPSNWGLSKPDKNIDHRRVPNLMVFFSRYGQEIPISDRPGDYFPGDIVCWDLGEGISHIGIVVYQVSKNGKRNLIVHNIGGGQVLADCLFEFQIIGHYRYGK